MQVLETDRVEVLRRRILETEYEYPAWHGWRLMVGDRELRRDDELLVNYQVTSGTVVELQARLHVKVGMRCPPVGRVHMVDCELTDRVFDAKKRLSDAKPEMPVSTRQAWLFSDGEELADYVTLKDYGISSGVVLDMAVREPLPKRLTIKTEDGRAFWFDIDEWDTLGDIRIKLACRPGGHADDALASIIFETEELDDDEQFFGAYGIPEYSTLFLNEKLLGQRISARAPSADKVPRPARFLNTLAVT
jgi:hypothetical protein